MRREALGLSQGRLGQHLGITFSQVQKYEKGANRIGAGRLFLLSEILRVPVHYFYDGLGEEPSETTARGAGDAEATALSDAFLSIPDPSTRRSVFALVCSLAGADPGPGLERVASGNETVRALLRPHPDNGPAPSRASS